MRKSVPAFVSLIAGMLMFLPSLLLLAFTLENVSAAESNLSVDISVPEANYADFEDYGAYCECCGRYGCCDNGCSQNTYNLAYCPVTEQYVMVEAPLDRAKEFGVPPKAALAEVASEYACNAGDDVLESQPAPFADLLAKYEPEMIALEELDNALAQAVVSSPPTTPFAELLAEYASEVIALEELDKALTRAAVSPSQVDPFAELLAECQTVLDDLQWLDDALACVMSVPAKADPYEKLYANYVEEMDYLARFDGVDGYHISFQFPEVQAKVVVETSLKKENVLEPAREASDFDARLDDYQDFDCDCNRCFGYDEECENCGGYRCRWAI